MPHIHWVARQNKLEIPNNEEEVLVNFGCKIIFITTSEFSRNGRGDMEGWVFKMKEDEKSRVNI
jgi:hypothetical protein